MLVKGQSTAVRWPTFGVVCVAYLAVTVGESALAPLYPVIAADLDVDVGGAGAALGLLAGSIAVANVAGGYLLGRWGASRAIGGALGLVVAGGALSAVAGSLPHLLAGQALLGLAAGTFFAPGIHAVGTIGGATRRGLVMGIFGTAFSLGLAVAALLGMIGDEVGWRSAFGVIALMGVAGAVALIAVELPGVPAASPATGRGLRQILGRATAVGSAAAVSQYGTVAFFPIFAVQVWDLSPGTAALILAVGRVVSIPAKAAAGHLSDTHGPLWTIRGLGVALAALGVAWTLSPTALLGAVPAALFAGGVSGAFPVANLLAFEELGARGPLLGGFRSVQMGTGALAAGAIGAAATVVDLRVVLLATVLAPVGLVVAATERRPPARFSPGRRGGW